MGSKSLSNLPVISIVTEDNVMLFSGQIKGYMVNKKPNTSGMKICEIVCYISALWRARCIPAFSCLILLFLWYMWMIFSFGKVHNLTFKIA